LRKLAGSPSCGGHTGAWQSYPPAENLDAVYSSSQGSGSRARPWKIGQAAQQAGLYRAWSQHNHV